MLAVLATPTFEKAVKKLHATERAIVDIAVKAIALDPALGKEKIGDLAGIFVHKFTLNRQKMLLAYQLVPDKFAPVSVLLLSIGSHENFYDELKRKI